MTEMSQNESTSPNLLDDNLPAKREPETLPAQISDVTNIIAMMVIDQLTAREVSERTGMPFMDVVEIVSSPTYLRQFSGIRRALAKTEFEAKAHGKLQEIIDREDTGPKTDANRIKAIHEWGQILGVSEGKQVRHKHEHNFKLETLIKNIEKDEGVVIDAEAEVVE